MVAASWGTSSKDHASVVLADAARYGGDMDPLIMWAKAQVEQSKPDAAAAAPMMFLRASDEV